MMWILLWQYGIVPTTIYKGVNLLDNAWSYEKGRSEKLI
jgi:predicted aldo/keto reductase-like oxidoreductase